MAHYALVDKNNVVVRVIVANDDQDPNAFDFTKAMADDIGGRWIQTSYNTLGGVHYNQDGTPSGQPGLRKNFAGPGMIYLERLDAFIPKQPYPSWILNEQSGLWEAPVPFPEPTDPNDRSVRLLWDETNVRWVEVTPAKYAEMLDAAKNTVPVDPNTGLTFNAETAAENPIFPTPASGVIPTVKF